MIDNSLLYFFLKLTSSISSPNILAGVLESIKNRAPLGQIKQAMNNDFQIKARGHFNELSAKTRREA
jgi:hypothetical protein